MSNTPETDEIEKHDGITIRDSVTTCGDESSSVYINVIHARQFERERNQAKEKYATEATEHMLNVNKICNERDEARELLESEKITRNHIIQRGIDMQKERDEAREEIKEWKTLCLWGGTPEHIHGFIRGQQSRIQHLECERDEAREKYATEATEHMLNVNKICNERDEAKNNIAGWENKWKCAIDMAARAEIERDDAQEDAKLLSERLTALELQSTAELARLEQELINIKELYESNN